MCTTSDKHRKAHFCVTDCVIKTCKTLKATFVIFVKLLTHFWDYSKIKELLESRLDLETCLHTKRRFVKLSGQDEHIFSFTGQISATAP